MAFHLLHLELSNRRKRIEELERVLAPFAVIAEDHKDLDRTQVVPIRVGLLREARDVLRKEA